MAIYYVAESEKYRPAKIRTLLIGEAPPPSGDKYFYVPRLIDLKTPIKNDRTLPATIFNHYFATRPKTLEEYIGFLKALQVNGIFLIDICQEPITVRGCHDGLQRIISEIPKLRGQMVLRGIEVPDSDIVFLLARGNYKKHIKLVFPASQIIPWITFRLSSPGRLN